MDVVEYRGKISLDQLKARIVLLVHVVEVHADQKIIAGSCFPVLDNIKRPFNPRLRHAVLHHRPEGIGGLAVADDDDAGRT